MPFNLKTIIDYFFISLFNRLNSYDSNIRRKREIEVEGKKPSIKDVAKKAEVSTATVSNVMNASRFVKEETKLKVLKAMEELNYRPSTVAKSLKGKDTKIIGLIIPIRQNDTSADFFISLANGIESVLNTKGYRLVISNSHENINNELEQIDMYNTQFTDYMDGLIIAPTSQNGKNVNELSYLQYPVVYVDRKPSVQNKVDTIYTNNYQITYEAIQLMVQKGRKRIAFISGPIDVSSTIERFQAYKDVLKDNQVPFDEKITYVGESLFESGYELTQKVLDQEIDGLVIVNNTMSMGAYKSFKEKKVSVPKQISFLSYDDFQWMSLTEPPITTIKQPAFEMGQAAAALMLEKLENLSKDPVEICIDSTLVIRGSL
ncbi:LacI family transcriptional regulator [Paenibacillus chitinolyticus]|uniref:LacI family transcriptional regulator n=1 Tax=Paenibacillus chitinolyticus TaxID=79263 RepID=A0A410WUF2_9BACL|nr:LacI family DNA-binding transcriptional regulator [Paenibacillus chitinolyticus]MCY9594078.1 LacI family transcriptional regulator [Paenibacillus chitinolyticus]MCY9596163.1 LacI family transcriptional regulator [Paenibacillus chitinolyticus]QAV18106.1 LacI family transcriptional regulator [Paenibacillus chitinolyticus]